MSDTDSVGASYPRPVTRFGAANTIDWTRDGVSVEDLIDEASERADYGVTEISESTEQQTTDSR